MAVQILSVLKNRKGHAPGFIGGFLTEELLKLEFIAIVKDISNLPN